MGLGEVISSIEGAQTLDELQRELQAAIESYGFAEFSFVDAGHPHLDEPFHFGSISKAWIEDYKAHNFVHFDPCVSLARRVNLPFLWSQVKLPPRTGKRKPAAQLLMEAANDHGYTNGYVFPFHFVDHQGRIYSTVNGLFWKEDAGDLYALLSTEKRHELNLILLYWTQRMIDLVSTEYRQPASFADLPDHQDSFAILTDREREILAWAGRGLTVSDTSDVLKISEETVQTHVKHAIEKLAATNKTHAVAKAMKLGLIDL
jgi:DNA-binding CsgD family transcriptional regulator